MNIIVTLTAITQSQYQRVAIPVIVSWSYLSIIV